MEMFASEIELQNEYQAVLLRAEKVGQIASLEYPPLPEDVYFITAEDVKGKNELSLFDRMMPVFASERVDYIGQVVGVVVAKSEDEAREVAKRINLVVQEENVMSLDLNSLASLEEVLQERREDIVFEKCKASEGWTEDFWEGREASTVSSFLHFASRLHYHAEPLTIKVRSKQQGLDVYVATQWAYHVQKTIARIIGENPERVKVNPTNESYSLNGRIWAPSLFAAIVAVASNVLKKNISLTFSFEEASYFYTRSPQVAIAHKSTLTPENTINSISVLCVIDAGAFNPLLNEMAIQMLVTALSMYRVPNYHVRVIAFRTNTHLTDLFIGWGDAYTNTAMENHINDIVETFSLHPLQFRLAHCLKAQEKTLTNVVRKEDYKIEAIMEHVAKKTTFMRKYSAYRAFNRGNLHQYEKYCRGIGLSCALQYNGLKSVIKEGISYSVEMTLTSSEELFIKAEPSMPLLKDILKKRCLKALDIEPGKIIFEPIKNMEPSSIGPSLPSCVSSILPLLLDRCIAELQKQRFRNPLPITVQKEYKLTKRNGWNEEELEGQPFISEATGCCVVELVLERSTYNVKVQNVNIVVEATDSLPNDYVISTVNRAVATALSVTLHEKIPTHNKRASDYTILNPVDMPRIDVEVLPSGNAGLRGISNLALNLVPQAVIAGVNQILQAEKVSHLPITQYDIFKLLEGKGAEDTATEDIATIEEVVEDARGESVEHLGGREIEAESEGVATTIPEYQSEGDDDDAKVHVEPAPQVEEKTEAESKDANEKEE